MGTLEQIELLTKWQKMLKPWIDDPKSEEGHNAAKLWWKEEIMEDEFHPALNLVGAIGAETKLVTIDVKEANTFITSLRSLAHDIEFGLV